MKNLIKNKRFLVFFDMKNDAMSKIEHHDVKKSTS